MFSDFKKEKITIENQGFGKAEITFRHGGSGEPLLLLHGNPMSHVTWHKIADELKKKILHCSCRFKRIRRQHRTRGWR